MAALTSGDFLSGNNLPQNPLAPDTPMILEFLFLTVLAFLISWLIVKSGRHAPGPFAGLWFFFLLFLLAGWAASLWIVPAGPSFYEIYWAGPLVVSVLLALILLSVMPGSNPRVQAEDRMRQARETTSETRARHAIEIGFTAFFWIATLGLVAIILFGLM